MVKVVIVGGGWAGCAAALAAAKAGAKVTLLEKTDQLLGTGLVGGIMRNNGRYTAAEEAIALGGGELFLVADRVARHRDVDFPGHKHATLYDVSKIEPAVRKLLEDYDIDLKMETRAGSVDVMGGLLQAVGTDDGQRFWAHVFVEATGTAGPQGNCIKYGNGCVMCILRCASYGPRISIAAKAGIQELVGGSGVDSLGAMSGSCKILKESLDSEIQEQLNKKGVVVVPLPPELRSSTSLARKACQQYALSDYVDNLILLDTGHCKLMASWFPLKRLRQIPGFSTARFEDPYAAGKGNSVRFLAISPRDGFLRVKGLTNLFCAGEKAGPLVGHTEAIVTGTLAGHNAVRLAGGKNLLALPRSLAIGDAIAYVAEQMIAPEGLRKKYTFSGSVYFERMQELGLFSTDRDQIKARVEKAGMTGIFDLPVC